mmetsp:Transcript_21560/g.43560  ORF Transcript_21560/g.43560 Transcript_21560/m.43560 type:complete len:105 (-) Transcript_21560:1024-1338(-)
MAQGVSVNHEHESICLMEHEYCLQLLALLETLILGLKNMQLRNSVPFWFIVGMCTLNFTNREHHSVQKYTLSELSVHYSFAFVTRCHRKIKDASYLIRDMATAC